MIPLALDRPVSVADPPIQSWAGYIQLCPPVVETVNWKRPLTFLLRGDAHSCAVGSWTKVFIGLINHGGWGQPPAYLWVIGRAVCGDKVWAR